MMLKREKLARYMLLLDAFAAVHGRRAKLANMRAGARTDLAPIEATSQDAAADRLHCRDGKSYPAKRNKEEPTPKRATRRTAATLRGSRLIRASRRSPRRNAVTRSNATACKSSTCRRTKP
jgi:hypothetical protein